VAADEVALTPRDAPGAWWRKQELGGIRAAHAAAGAAAASADRATGGRSAAGGGLAGARRLPSGASGGEGLHLCGGGGEGGFGSVGDLDRPLMECLGCRVGKDMGWLIGCCCGLFEGITADARRSPSLRQLTLFCSASSHSSHAPPSRTKRYANVMGSPFLPSQSGPNQSSLSS